MNWFNKKKKKAIIDNEILKQRSEETLETHTLEMTSKYCPINGYKCSTECIHFKKGFTFYSKLEASYFIYKPYCKLWK